MVSWHACSRRQQLGFERLERLDELLLGIGTSCGRMEDSFIDQLSYRGLARMFVAMRVLFSHTR